MNTFNLLIILVILILTILIKQNIKADSKIKYGIRPDRAKELIKNNYFDYIIDVRTEKEWREDRLVSSINIPLDNLYEGVKLYELNSRYLIYCKSGRRASIGAAIMRKMGFKNVYFLIDNYRLIK
jgi:rhodanese-related sulfurtransferase